MSSRHAPPRLLPGEKLLKMHQYEDARSKQMLSADEAFMHLCQGSTSAHIGDFGPALASLPLESHKNEPAFRRYEVVFGRDSIRAASDVLHVYPKLARATLLFLGAQQGVIYSSAREEEPGRILHEYRDPEQDAIARQLSSERGWDWPYYGSVDATPAFVSLLAKYCRTAREGYDILDVAYENRRGKSSSLLDALLAAENWMIQRIQNSPSKMLEFRRAIPGGIENQVWRDSWDSFSHADGSLAASERGVVSTEAQVATMDALIDAAEIHEYLRDKARPEHLRAYARELSRTVLDTCWTDEKGGYFVLGLDRDEKNTHRPLLVRTADMGHLLDSRLLEGSDPEIVRRRETTVKQLFTDEMMAFSGVRTLASDEKRFRPGAYQNGSVWPWQNYLIARGLRRHGHGDLAKELEEKIISACQSTRRFPEYLRGGSETEHLLNTYLIEAWDDRQQRKNVVEQPPQDIYVCTASAMLSAQSIL